MLTTLALWSSAAFSHDPKAVAHADKALGCSFEPWVLACLGVSAILYVLGVTRLWRRARTGHGVSMLDVGCFATGWLVVAAALVSPLDALGRALFSAHMVQHELLMTVAAPLLVLGRPLGAWVWAFPVAWQRPVGDLFHRPAWRRPWLILTAPLWAWTFHALALWLWHVPALFQMALESETVHTLQHASFFGTALVFWWSVLGAVTRKGRGIALLSLFTTMAHSGALGALLTLSTVAWYADYGASAPAWGFTALQDQQLGGIIMWVPTGLVYLVCALWLSTRWLSATPRAANRLA